MPRISELARLPMIDANLGHWSAAEASTGTPILIDTNFGLPQVQALRTQYHTLSDLIQQLNDSELSTLRSERDGIWGTDSDDEQGVWSRLTQYKALVRARLGRKHPLSRTIPNIGRVVIERYLEILHAFSDHWTRVNGALSTPLTLGVFALADLQAAHAGIDAKQKAIKSTLEGLLPLKREEREQLFGDVKEDDREETSIVARLFLYQAVIRSRFPGAPIANSLPPIFEVGGSAPLPTFEFNWVVAPDGRVKTWFAAASLPAGAALLFLKEGNFAQTAPLPTNPPNGQHVLFFTGVTVVGELDEVEIRNGAGLTIARGTRLTALPEPPPV